MSRGGRKSGEKRYTGLGNSLMRNSWGVVMTGVYMKGRHGSKVISDLESGQLGEF